MSCRVSTRTSLWTVALAATLIVSACGGGAAPAASTSAPAAAAPTTAPAAPTTAQAAAAATAPAAAPTTVVAAPTTAAAAATTAPATAPTTAAATAPTTAPAAGATTAPAAAGEADPAVLLKALGTSENVDPTVMSALARASNLSAADQELALKCWKENVCETGRGTKTVAMADGFGENVWRQITHMEFVLQAVSYPDVKKIIYTSARGDASKAVSDMRSLVAQKVDVIVSFPDAGEALLPVAKEATAAGIVVVPYIGTFGGNAGEDYLTYVAEDLCDLGSQFAQTAIDETGGAGNVVQLGGTPGNPLSSAWQKCAGEVLAANPDMKLLGTADTNWTQEGTIQAMSAFLSQNEDIDAVLYEYADGFRGGVRAYEAANRPLDLVLTLRTDEQGLFCDWEKINNPNFKIFFSTGGSFQSRIALTAAMDKLDGKTIPPNVVVPFKMRQVEKGMCDAALPLETPLSTVVPPELLREMFKS